MLGMLRMRAPPHAGTLIVAALLVYVQLQAMAIEPTLQPLNHTSGQGANVTMDSMATGTSSSGGGTNTTTKPSGAAPSLRSGALSLLFPVAAALRARC